MKLILRNETYAGGNEQRTNWNLLPLVIAVLTLSTVIITDTAFAQNETAALAERSSIVVLGKVLKVNASDEPMVEPSAQTAIISVQKMYAGSESVYVRSAAGVTTVSSVVSSGARAVVPAKSYAE